MVDKKEFLQRSTRLIDCLKQHQTDSKFFISLSEEDWVEMVNTLKTDRLVFLMMWCKEETINILFLEGGYKPIGVKIPVSLDRYLALSTVRPAAILYERMIWELWGKEAMNAVNLSPWLDRGLWKNCWPLSKKPGPVLWPPEAPEYQSVPHLVDEGGEISLIDPSCSCEDLPVLWHFSNFGERIIKAESIYGYTHRGVLTNLYNKNALKIVPIISRMNALDSISHQIAFSHAIEDIAGFIPSLSILRRRILFLELSRISAYLFYLSKLFRKLDIVLISSRCDLARELLMRWNLYYFGHRWLMDCVFPGTVLKDERDNKVIQLPQKIKYLIDQAFKLVSSLPGLKDYLQNKGILPFKKAVEFNLGGVVGRASGRDIDLRRYMSEYRLEWLPPTNFIKGDVDARMNSWFVEIKNSINIVEIILQENDIEEGSEEVVKDIIIESLNGEGIGVCEGVQGDLWYYVYLEGGNIKDIFIRDPAANQAYILQNVLTNESIDDHALIQSSFGILTTGVDL